MSRRMYDGGATYFGSGFGADPGILHLNVVITHAALGLALFQVPFIFNFFYSIVAGKKVTSDNPWNATTLDWQTPTPPPHGNFAAEPVAVRGPYDYSLPGAKTDYTPQNQGA
jgi:cytochrome c oxidase subunit 1